MKVFNTPTNYQSLFPNEEYNNISEEYSIYGPGAYLVYLLNKATDKAFVHHTQEDLELLKRRPDLNLLQINADNNTKKHYYLEGVVNVLMNTLNGWESTDKNSWKKASDNNQTWQDIASGISSFIPYNRAFELIKNRLEKAELPLHHLTAKLHTESYDSFSWVYSKLGLNYLDVEMLKSEGGDVSTWLKNNSIAINRLLYSNNVAEKELLVLINNQVFLSFFGMNEISISHNENEVFLNIQEGDLKKLRCFMILANATQWKYSTLIAVFQVLEIKVFTNENTALQLQKIAQLSLIAEVFEDIKKSEFLNKSLVKNRLTSINLSFTNKNIQNQSTDEENILNFLKNISSLNELYRLPGNVEALYNWYSPGKPFQGSKNFIQLQSNLFEIASLIKRIQNTGHSVDEIYNFLKRLKEFIVKNISEIVHLAASKDLENDEVLSDFQKEVNSYLSNAIIGLNEFGEFDVNKYLVKSGLSVFVVEMCITLNKVRNYFPAGIDIDIELVKKTVKPHVKKFINNLDEFVQENSHLNFKLVENKIINSFFENKLAEILMSPYAALVFAQTLNIRKEVVSIFLDHIMMKQDSKKDLKDTFDYLIGILHLQKYLDESTGDNSGLIQCLSDEKINRELLIQQVAKQEKCNPEEITEIFNQSKISESTDGSLLYQTLYKVRVYRKMYNKLQLSASDTTAVIRSMMMEKQGKNISDKLDSLLTEEVYGEQLMAHRDILVPMVFHKLGKEYEDINNADRLSEYLLMDVQTSDKIKITPVREAINAVQWYMANVKSGLEDVDKTKLSAVSAENWLYIEKFRIWQAEQKLELYPNEYFQIDNLDNASELYQQLKLKLQGDKVNDDIIKSSLMDYLEQWSHLSMNEVVASYAYQLNDKSMICLLAKCRDEPNIYYYANTEIANNGELQNTSEWRKIDTPIDADAGTLNIIYAFDKYYIFYTKIVEENISISSSTENCKLYKLKTCSVNQNINGWSQEKKWYTFDFHIQNEDIVNESIDSYVKEEILSGKIPFKPILHFFENEIHIFISHFRYFKDAGGINTEMNNLINSKKCTQSLREVFHQIKLSDNDASTFLLKGKISISDNFSMLDMLIDEYWGNAHILLPTTFGKYLFKTDYSGGTVSDFDYYNKSLFSLDLIEGYQDTFELESKLYFDVFNQRDIYIKDNCFIKIHGLVTMHGWNGLIFNTSLNSFIIHEDPHTGYYTYNDKYCEKDSSVKKIRFENSEESGEYQIIPFVNKYSFFLKQLVSKFGIQKIYSDNILGEGLNAFLYDNGEDLLSFTQEAYDLRNHHDEFNQIYHYSGSKIEINSTQYIQNSFDTLYAKEFFIYIPCLIASYLRNNLQYEEAVKWLEKVFNPHKKEKDVLQYFFDESNKHKALLNKWLFEQYVNTLFDWADNEYRTATWESINHATQLYLQIEDLLGDEIKVCDKNAVLHKIEDRSFSKIKAKITTYFGTPSHNTINELRTNVQTRLYNLRNGLNLDGKLFTPSEYGAVIDQVSVQLLRNTNSLDSNGLQALQDKKRIYQFRDLMPVTESIIDTVIQFGNQFYSILQQKDNEEIQLLMHTQTMAAELFVTQNFEFQIQEIELQLNALQTNQKSGQLQLAYYSSLLSSGIIEQERSAFTMQHEAHNLQLVANRVRTGAAIAHLLPNTFGMANGGMKFGDAIEAGANVTDMIAHNKILKAQLITDEAEAKRRALDLAKEINISIVHLEEIAFNIKATEKRLEIIKSNLAEHTMRIAQQKTMLDHLTTKFTNVDLYSWMSAKLSSLYFSVYQIGLSSLTQLQDSYNYELVRTDSFISQNSWDSLKKGLLAGEGLKLALTQLKESYFRNNVRRKEVEKVISLRKKFEKEEHTTKWNTFIDEGGDISFGLFVSDFYSNKSNKSNKSDKLRIKSISVSVPGIVGAYETFDIMLKNNIFNQDIEVSRGINDFGVFPESINDGRYMPFEGIKISEESAKNKENWTLKYSKEGQTQISDVVLTVRLQVIS